MKLEEAIKREVARIGKSQRNCVPPRQCETSHILSNKWEEVMSYPSYSPDRAPSAKVYKTF